MLDRLKFNLDLYVKERRWFLYAPFWVLAVYLLILVINFNEIDTVPWPLFLPAGFSFVIHELAHLVTSMLPLTLSIIAGSAAEILFGLLLLVTALHVRAYFLAMYASVWFMVACERVAIYIADARTQSLELVSLGSGGSPIHDWNFLLEKWGLLEQDALIANIVRWIGIITATATISLGLYLLVQMKKSKTLTSAQNALNLATALTSNPHDQAAQSTTLQKPATPEVRQETTEPPTHSEPE